jgi:hypothetical protein
MKYQHFEMARMIVGRKINTNTMFAVWRLDSPWLPVTKKVPNILSKGKMMKNQIKFKKVRFIKIYAVEVITLIYLSENLHQKL